MADSTAKGFGQQDPADSVGGFNPHAFHINQRLARANTIKVVQVIAVNTDAFTVDVQIAVNQLDGQNNATPHGTIYSIPYGWIMGGTNAFQIDPAVGDLGVMAISDRDISAVKNTKAIANPGSLRKFSPSDGIYLFGIPALNSAPPTQWFKWTSGGGYNITDSFGNVQQATNAGISINGVVFNRSGQVAGNLPVTGALELGGSIENISGGLYTGDIHIGGTLTGDTDVIAAGKSGKSHSHEVLGGVGSDVGPPT